MHEGEGEGKHYNHILDVAKSRIGTIAGGSVAQSKEELW